MHQRGQIQLSFTMIFSLFMIIITVVVAFYVIQNFIGTSECIKVQLFYEDLEKEVDNVWRSSKAQIVFNGALSSDISSVCFGSPGELSPEKYSEQYRALRRYVGLEGNVFLFPPLRKCDSNLLSHTVSHAQVPTSFCAEVKENKVSVTLVKASSADTFVTIKP